MPVPTRCRAAACALLLGSACSAPTPSASAEAWRYRVALRDGGDVLDVRLTLPPGPRQRVAVAPAAAPFVLGLEAGDDGAVTIPAADAPRALQWRFLARQAGARIDDIDLAAWRGDGFVGSLGAFLLHPQDDAGARRFELQVTGPWPFACANPSTANGWSGDLQDLPMLPPCAFGALARRTIARADTHIEVVELGRRTAGGSAALDAWVADAADAVSTFCGAFPVPRLLLVVAPGQQQDIGGGSARGLGGGTRIFVDVPPGFGAADFRRDWVLFHEMVHLALPSLAPQHHWLEEGSATYLEPLLQARAGRVPVPAVWQEMLENFDQGLAAPDAGGLDDDHSWGRTYYGGAIFCLCADVEIRRRTDNRRSLQDAMRAIVAAGGNISAMWPLERVLQTGDAGTGTTVLADLYAAMRSRPEPRELQSLWRDLGVRLDGDRVVFDDAAPLAAVRRALVPGA